MWMNVGLLVDLVIIKYKPKRSPIKILSILLFSGKKLNQILGTHAQKHIQMHIYLYTHDLGKS